MNQAVEACRLYRFEASHGCWGLLDTVGSKESKIHGHNFEVQLITADQIQKSTGLSIDLNKLDNEVERVIKTLDHRNLTDLYFNRKISVTHEFLVNYLSEKLLSPNESVTMIALTTDVSAIYPSEVGWAPHSVYTYGGVFMKHKMFSERSYQFSASHNLTDENLSEEKNNSLYGKCTRLHGHDYILSVTISGIPNINTGVIFPYTKMDSMMNEIIKKIDGYVLSNHELLQGKVATSENILMALWPIIEEQVSNYLAFQISSGSELKLYEITLQETARNFFTYRGNNE